MPIKKGSIIVVSILTACLFYACEQKANKVTIKPDTRRIPVSVNDSLLLSIDRSPMDMSYFPEDYPKQKMMTPDLPNPVARVIYSRPQRNGRTIFADTSVTENVIQHYGEEWRLGANEATEIEFYKPVSIGGKKLDAGRYILYCIPYPDKWKLIFNNNLYSWGLHIDKTKDQAEIELPVIKNNVVIEFFTMFFQNSTYGCDLVMAWGDMKVVLPVNFN